MIKLGIVYGGVSTEHDISVMSAKSVIENLDKEKYEIHEIYINKYGKWYEVIDDEKEEIYNLIWTLKKLDVVFPVLHGLGGEDGTIQGMLEMLQVPYVGCKVLASSVGMDKVYTKIIFEKAGIPEAPYVYIKKKDNGYIIVNENFEEEEFKVESITKKLNYPMFVKPSNSGSSVGVKKATNNEELKMAIENASQYDNKILIEQGINAREVECAILDGTEVRASTVGEIMSAEEFYSFDAKYNIPESKTIIPADISKEQIEQIQKLAIRAFKAIDGRGLARADFFIEKDTNKIYINEINTMPGFTKISMYPKLFEAVGITYTELLDKLIENTK
ncbi:d-alanine--D-alanine ligase 2 [Clostridium sp. CAG:356]|nr:d-alanine--D-alanine ligase 2 [Clostridium sp. CAG:356]